MESFIQGLKPYALKTKLMDEFKMNIIQDIDSLISKTIVFNESIAPEETNPKFRNHQRRHYFRNTNSDLGTRTSYPNSNPRNKEPAGETKSCSFCKKDGHSISPKSKTYSNPKKPKRTTDNSRRTTRSQNSRNNFISVAPHTNNPPPSPDVRFESDSDNSPIEFDLDLPQILSNTFCLKNTPKLASRTLDIEAETRFAENAAVSVPQKLTSPWG
ncbi:hypothetical protein GEMRC1_011206 [Eukaryota sp. GEM-RC1]